MIYNVGQYKTESICQLERKICGSNLVAEKETSLSTYTRLCSLVGRNTQLESGRRGSYPFEAIICAKKRFVKFLWLQFTSEDHFIVSFNHMQFKTRFVLKDVKESAMK